ncbi:hypothetical protein E1161_19450 [Saccharopolyspora aridisoli]|uniref:Uncharacterized protein n=1 Tax=Saccharopolyspora aridisoli TaxID=2530385 RepID=A0A4R4UP69_9PSEU|nr:hypothetical protein [Saccharopolyspora aridisoli]TDC90283.1 hypothetical protein E1161_19450 [Saccharopolyspora aridisoli]
MPVVHSRPPGRLEAQAAVRSIGRCSTRSAHFRSIIAGQTRIFDQLSVFAGDDLLRKREVTAKVSSARRASAGRVAWRDNGVLPGVESSGSMCDDARPDEIEEDFQVRYIRRQPTADDREGTTRLLLRAAWLQLLTALVR